MFATGLDHHPIIPPSNNAFCNSSLADLTIASILKNISALLCRKCNSAFSFKSSREFVESSVVLRFQKPPHQIRFSPFAPTHRFFSNACECDGLLLLVAIAQETLEHAPQHKITDTLYTSNKRQQKTLCRQFLQYLKKFKRSAYVL